MCREVLRDGSGGTMSETRSLRNPSPGDVETWRAQFDELELRMDALRQAFLDGARSFTMTVETVERIHGRFDDLGEQLHKMHCTYPFGGWPGQEDCRFEPPVTYESDAHKPADV
jgi:hypothetical protein